MALSAFADKANRPQDDDVVKTLGRSSSHWRAIVETAARDHAPLAASWIYSGAAWGWALRLSRRKRNLVYLTPCQKHFFAGFALGEKAVQAAEAAGLSDAVLGIIRDSKQYAEGRAVRLDVRSKPDRDAVLLLLSIKAEN